jgi:hypothetical protein
MKHAFVLLALFLTALPASAAAFYRQVDARWQMSVLRGSPGACFTLQNTQTHTAHDTFAVAFDAHDPLTNNPFNADGNIYGRPQREVALYWNGAEVVRRLSPVEFRGSTLRPVQVFVRFVCGGARVTVRISGIAVYAAYFVPEMSPYPAQAKLTGPAHTVTLRALTLAWLKPAQAAAPPLVLTAIRDLPLDNAHRRQSAVVPFPAHNAAYGRLLCTLTLSKPPKGYDPWDRQGAVYAYDAQGERFELLRFITPYGRGGKWTVDVSDYRPLLRGQCRIEAWCETYSTGWDATVTFRFYPGHAARLAYKVINLWHGQPTIGDPLHPISDFFTPQTVVRPPDADFVTLRFIVTGHGQAPNTDDAAEFLPTWRAVSINGMNFPSLLWKTDNYLNPCSPQGGTWKYDRAGWGPGTVVAPWDIPATRWMPRGQPSVIRYQESPFVNKTPDAGNPARHWIESQVIFFRKNSK